MKRFVISVLAAACGFYAACRQPTAPQPQPVPHSGVRISVLGIAPRWATLRFATDSPAVSQRLLLLRNWRDTVYNGNAAVAPQTVQDTGLLPGTAYQWQLYRMLAQTRWDSASAETTTLAISNPRLTTRSWGFGEGDGYLRGIWVDSASHVAWMCGFMDSVDWGGGIHTIIRYDGKQFTFMDAGGTLEGCDGVDSGDVWFCGGSGGTYVEHYYRGNWTEYFPLDTILGELYSIYVTPDKHWVYTVSVTGHILRLNRLTNTWEDMPNPALGNYGLSNIIGFGDDTLFAVGINANSLSDVLEFDGTQWKTILQSVSSGANDSTAVLGSLYGIGGYSPDSLYIVGDYIYKRKGNRWVDVTPTPFRISYCVAAPAWNRVYVGGYQQLLFWNGEAWYQEGSGGLERIFRIYVVDSTAYAVGGPGADFTITK